MFAAIVLIITAAVNAVYAKRRGGDLYGTNKFASIPAALQICNFGSSHGIYAFNYEKLENRYDCFNFGLTAQFPSYDYILFQYYGDHIMEGTVVFIPISYSSLFGTGELGDTSFSSINMKYYSFLPASSIKEYDALTDIRVRYFPALSADTGDLIRTLLGISKPVNNRDVGIVATDIDIDKHAANRFDVHIGDKRIYYDADGNRIENQEEIDALCALVRGCQEKGAVPILITTPFLHEYTDQIKENAPEFYDHFYSVIDRVVRDTGVEYYDYAFDERFANEYSWFINSDHLNQEGARNFTDIVMEEIVYAKGYLDK